MRCCMMTAIGVSAWDTVPQLVRRAALDTETGKPVALKLVQAELLFVSEKMRHRFDRGPAMDSGVSSAQAMRSSVKKPPPAIGIGAPCDVPTPMTDKV